MKFLGNFVTKSIVITLSVVVFIMLLTTSFCYITELQIQPLITVCYFAVIMIISFVFSYLAVKAHRKSKVLFLIVVLLVSGTIFCLWNIFAKTIPVSDYEIIYGGAKQILDGSFAQHTFNNSDYFYYFNHQIGHAVFLAGEIKIFGDHLSILKTLEAFYVIFAGFLVYLVCGKQTGNYEFGAVACILYICYIPNILGSSILNNQHVSAIFILIALYFSLYDRWWGYIIVGLALGIGNFIRPLGIVIIPAFILYIIYNAIIKKQIYKNFARVCCLIITYVLIVNILNSSLIVSGLTPQKVSQSPIPYFKFVIGLGRQEGDFNIANVPYSLKKNNYDYNEYNKECIIYVKNQFLVDGKTTFFFIIDKMYAFLSRIDNQLVFAVDKDQYNNSYLILLRDVGQIQYLFLILLSFLNLYHQFKNKKFVINAFSIFFILLVCAHLFIETQARYRYELYICLNMWAGSYIYDLVKEKSVPENKDTCSAPMIPSEIGSQKIY